MSKSEIVRAVIEDWTGEELKVFEGKGCEDEAIECWEKEYMEDDVLVVGYDADGNRLGLDFG